MDKERLLQLRVASIPALTATIALLEAQQFFGLFRFLTLAASFLLLVVIASLLRGKLRDAALVLASVAFGLILVEGASIVAEPRISTTVSEGLYTSMPVVGWGPSHSGQYHAERIDLATGRVIYNVDYTIDEKFLRRTYSTDSGPTVVFFGDSLTFGIGLNDTDTLPQQFADLLDHKVRVLNLAYGGYGPAQFLQILQENLHRSVIGPNPMLFVFTTAAWHTERTACKSYWARRAPRFVLDNDRLSLEGTCGNAQNVPLRDWLRHFASYRLLVEPLTLKPNDGDVELYIRTLLEAVSIAEQRYGVRTIVPYLRTKGYLRATKGFTDDSVMARLRQGGAIVLDFSLAEERARGAVLAIPGDDHPTPLANRLRAVMLKEYLARNMTWISASELGSPPL